MEINASTPRQIFDLMYKNDAFSQWLGIRLVDIGEGFCTLEMDVRPEMTNGFGVAHGGISFSLADSTFAFACNSRGRHAVSIHCTVEHTAPIRVDDVLTATASEDHLGNSVSNYAIRVTNQRHEVVALFRGVAYRKQREW
jgi:acyl-CoA thioesterase